MIIRKELLFEGSKGELNMVAMFDSGATYSCITPEKAEKIAVLLTIRHPFKVQTASKGHFIVINNVVRLDFYIGKSHFSDEFIVVPNLSEDVIIGAATLQKWRFHLDFEHDDVIFDPAVTKIQLM